MTNTNANRLIRSPRRWLLASLARQCMPPGGPGTSLPASHGARMSSAAIPVRDDRERPNVGTEPTCRHVRFMLAIGGKADVARTWLNRDQFLNFSVRKCRTSCVALLAAIELYSCQ